MERAWLGRTVGKAEYSSRTIEGLDPLVQRVTATIQRRAMFKPGDRIGVAVSGGADSVCLLHVLLELAPSWRLCLSVLHLDHQLRGEESTQDAEFVRDVAARLKVPLISRRGALARGNLEEAGRRARLAFFGDVIRSGAVDRVATAHTRSDQAETVLFRLIK